MAVAPDWWTSLIATDWPGLSRARTADRSSGVPVGFAVDGDDHVSFDDPGFRSGAAGGDAGHVDAVASGVPDSDREVGAVGVDDVSVLDDLAGDVGDDVAGDGEADARLPPSCASLGGEGWDPDHASVDVDERAARVARVDRGAGLDRFGRVAPLLSVSWRLRALTMPSVTLELSPSGLPMAIAMSPTRSFEESAKVAGRSPVPLTLITARSSGVKRPTSVALRRFPVEVVTVNAVAVPTTWSLVTMLPFLSKTIPEPSPSEVLICTTEGETAR